MSGFMKRSREMDMCTGPLTKKIIVFALPLMLTSLLQFMFNMADTVVVGRFSAEGNDALAAVGTCGPTMSILLNLAFGLSIGTDVLVAQCYGAKDFKRLSDAVHTSVFAALAVGVLISAVGVLSTPLLLRLVSVPADILPMARTYMLICFFGFSFTAVYNFGAAILRAVGDTTRPLLFMLLSGALNVVLNLIFVIVLHMSVAGVALATVISEGVSAFLVILTLMRTDACYRFRWRELRCCWPELKKIVSVGLPAGVQHSLFSISNTVVQSAYNSFGKAVMAGNTAALNVELILTIVPSSLQNAALAFTSQNVGANRIDNIRKIEYRLLLMNLVLCACIALICQTCGKLMLSIYDVSDPAVLEAGLVRLERITSLYVIAGMMEMYGGFQRGFGHSVQPMIVALLGTCIFRVLWVQLALPLSPTLEMLSAVYPISWALTLSAHFTLFRRIMKKASAKATGSFKEHVENG